MRNLKRALSLTLASVMLLGMMVVGSSAMSFNDADEISNVTAATVLEELDIMVGDGVNFNPDQVVTRGEMAVIVCKILYGEKLNVSQFIDGSKFTDVPANHYANGYVNLANQLGIIAGYGNGMFGPSDTVTTAQAALMLTKALGYFKGSELTGDWSNDALTAAATATRLGLFSGLNLGTHEGLTRDNVAAMTFNTITNAVPVQYSEFFHSYYTDQSSILQGVQYDWKDTLGYANFSLVYTDSDDKDEFGRPAIVWGTGTVADTDSDGKLGADADVTLKEDFITSPKDADKVYVGEVKAKDIYSDLNMSRDVDKAQVYVYTDSDTATKTKDVNKNDSDTKFGTDGQTVEVWYTKGATAAADEVTIVITSTYLGIVVDDNYREDGKDGIRIDVMGVGLKFFEATGYNDDDVVLVTVADGDVQAITGTPKTITGETTRVSTDVNKALTIDGTKYPQSVQFSSGDGDVVDGESNANLAIEKTYTLYLDQNDCYLAAVEVEDNASTDLVYIHDIDTADFLDSSSNKVEEKLVATVVYMDGTFKEVPLTKANNTDITNPGSQKTAMAGTYNNKLAELVYDEDDKEYELKAIDDGSYDQTDSTVSGTKIELKDDSRYAKLDGANTVYLNGSTVYIFVTAKDVPHADEIDDVKIVTGGVDYDIAIGTKLAYAVKDGETTARYVVIAGEYEAASKDIVYIKAGGPKQVITDGRLYEGWFADSTEKEEISVDKSTTSYTSLAAGFYEYSEKSNGNLKLTAVTDVYSTDNAGQAVDKTIDSITKDDQGYLMTLNTVSGTIDLNNVNVVDMTDKDKDAENTYGSNVTSLSALQRVVDQKTGGVKAYVVTVSVYVNKDNEVTNLVISNIANKSAGRAAVYQTAEQSDITLTAASNTITIGGQNITVASSDDIDGFITKLGAVTALNNAWTFAKANSDEDITFTAKSAGAVGTSGPAEALVAGLTKESDGEEAKAATVTINVLAANANSTSIGNSNTSQDITGANATGTDNVNGYSWKTEKAENGTDYVVTVTKTTPGNAGNGETDGLTFAGGADAVEAVYKLTDIAGKIATATSESKDITLGGHTATVTHTTVADYLAEFVADYNANATDRGIWTASVEGNRILFTAKTPGAIGGDGPASEKVPTDTTVKTAGADAN